MRFLCLTVLMLFCAPAHAGAAIVLKQVVPNPALPEPAGEFVVVENTGGSTVLLDGARLTDATGAVRGVVPPDTSLDPGQRIALQPAAGASVYGCTGFYRALLTAWPPLNNDGDSVVLEAPDGRVLDRVTYGRDAYAVDSDATPCGLPAPRPGTVALAGSTYLASEGDRSVTLAVRRTGGTNGRVVVPYRVLDASARAGEDYAGSDGSVALGATRDSGNFSVPLFDDARDEADETFTVVLGAPGGGASLGEPARAVVVVRDDDPPPGPTPTPVIATTPAPRGVDPAWVSAVPAPASLGALPAPAGSSADRPAHVAVAVAPWQSVLRRREIVAAVTCDRDCTVAARGRIAIGSGRFVRLVTGTRSLRGHMPSAIALRVRTRHVRVLRRALRRRGSLPATVVVSPAGGTLVERGARVR